MCLAVPAQVLERLPEDRAKVRLAGIVKEISLALVPEAEVGDFVVVHVGFALARLNAEEAERTLATLEELGALEEIRQELAEAEEARP